jgi:Multiubiquitin
MDNPEHTNITADDHDKPEHDKTVEIIVNAQKHDVPKGNITFEALANLAYNGSPPSGPNVVITITYSRGEDGKQGSLLAGGTVKTKEGMVFNVRATDRS